MWRHLHFCLRAPSRRPISSLTLLWSFSHSAALHTAVFRGLIRPAVPCSWACPTIVVEGEKSSAYSSAAHRFYNCLKDFMWKHWSHSGSCPNPFISSCFWTMFSLLTPRFLPPPSSRLHHFCKIGWWFFKWSDPSSEILCCCQFTETHSRSATQIFFFSMPFTVCSVKCSNMFWCFQC